MIIRHLFTRLTIFLVPFGLVIGCTIGLAIYSGEAMSYENVLDIQQENPQTLFVTYNMSAERVLSYKLLAIQRQTPEVVIVGSSRVLAFESSLLDDPNEFYNMGISGGYLNALQTYIDTLTPENAPTVLIIGIDSAWFTESAEAAFVQENLRPHVQSFDDVTSAASMVMKSFVRDSTALNQLIQRETQWNQAALGLVAVLEGSGYQWDGNYQVPPDITPKIGQGSARTQFKNADNVPLNGWLLETNLARLDKMLTQAEALNIQVIGFTTPYSSARFKLIDEAGADIAFFAIRGSLKDLFLTRQISYFDFSDITILGATDDEMQDHVHVFPRLAARMFAVMAREVPALRAYADPDRIERAIAESPDPIHVFGDS